MAPTLYHFPRCPPCCAVQLTVRALGLELNYKIVDLSKDEHMKDWYLEICPAHVVPSLDDEGFHLWESRTIMKYLVDTYGKDDTLYPKDRKARARVDQMLDFDVSTIYATVLQLIGNYKRGNSEIDEITKTKLDDGLMILDKILKKTRYVAGDKMTIADLSLMVTVTSLAPFDIDYTKHQTVCHWIKQIQKEATNIEEFLKSQGDYIAFMKSCIKK